MRSKSLQTLEVEFRLLLSPRGLTGLRMRRMRTVDPVLEMMCCLIESRPT